MDIGIRAAQHGRLADPAAVRALASAAELLGYSSVWADAGAPTGSPASLDAVAVLSMTAAVTARVRIGLRVDHPRSDPAIAAMVDTLHRLSDGRLVVGLGIDPVDDAVPVLLDRWPAGSRRPTLLVAGPELTGLDEPVGRADGWHATEVPVDVLASRWQAVQDVAAAAGRAPGELRLVVPVDVALTATAGPTDHRRPFTGTLDDVAADLDATRRAGAHEVVLRVEGDPTVDEVLDVYARVAEAVQDRTGGRLTS